MSPAFHLVWSPESLEFRGVDVRVAGFPRICVRVACFPWNRRPRGQIPRDLRSRGKNRHGNVDQGVKNHADVKSMERPVEPDGRTPLRPEHLLRCGIEPSNAGPCAAVGPQVL